MKRIIMPFWLFLLLGFISSATCESAPNDANEKARFGHKYYEIDRAGVVRRVKERPTQITDSASSFDRRSINIQMGQMGGIGSQAVKPYGSHFVSIAEINSQYFVLANYVDLLLLDRKTGSLCVIDPVNRKLPASSLLIIQRQGMEETTIYNPTGVFVDENANLYVANYKGNNVLRGKVDTENCSVQFSISYSSPNTGGPENVFVDSQRDIFVSANYDQGTVTAFRISDGMEVWSSSIGQAHGVSIQGDSVYATGLSERKIYKLSLEDGKQLASKGSFGWDPASSEYIWPTSIFPLDSKHLIVSDAQSGFISILDAETLEVVRFTGGNGPSFNLFNYPYSAVPYSEGIVIVSGHRRQILFLDKPVSSVVEYFRLAEDHWPSYSKNTTPFGSEWKGYIAEDGNLLSIGSRNYKLGFAHLYPEKAGTILRVPDIGTLYNLGSYIYFLQGAKLGDELSIFFSSSSTSLIGVVGKLGKPYIILFRQIPIDTWLVEGALVNSDGEFLTLDRVKEEFLSRANDLYSVLDKQLWLTKKDLLQSISPQVKGAILSHQEYLQFLDQVFVTRFGREFKLAYDRCTKDACDINILQEAARKYYSEAMALTYLNIDEFILVGMVSGIAFDKINIKPENFVFDGCGIGKWYPGYGFEALQTRTLEDYYSAIDLESSDVCISKFDGGKFSLKEIMFGWYDEKESAQSFEVFVTDTQDLNTKERSLGIFKLKAAFKIGDYFFSAMRFDSRPEVQRLRLRLIQGGDQNRLILRSLTVNEPEMPEPQNLLSSLSLLAGDISRSMEYGSGVTKLPDEALITLPEAAAKLGEAKTAHCGNYALMFISKLQEDEQWTFFGLAAFDGRIHSVVQVSTADGIRTFDPTLGITYNCRVKELINGDCNYDSIIRTGISNPVMDVYEGAGFFYGAKVLNTFTQPKELLDLYR